MPTPHRELPFVAVSSRWFLPSQNKICTQMNALQGDVDFRLEAGRRTPLANVAIHEHEILFEQDIRSRCLADPGARICSKDADIFLDVADDLAALLNTSGN